MGVEDAIRFVEVRAGGKRSAVSMTTPTSTDVIKDDEGGEAIDSAYKCQQRCPMPRSGSGPGKATPIRQPPRPHPNQRTRPPQPEEYLSQGTEPEIRAHQPRHLQLLRPPGPWRTGAHCPAFGTTCSSCGRQNHTANTAKSEALDSSQKVLILSINCIH